MTNASAVQGRSQAQLVNSYEPFATLQGAVNDLFQINLGG